MAPNSHCGLSTLLVDIGNTNLKWAWLNAAGLSDIKFVSYRQEGVAAAVRQVWGEMEHPHRVLVANVAGEQQGHALAEWMLDQWGMVPEMVVSQAMLLGVENGYAEPQRLGVDRWLALIAMRQREPGPVCVVDCGTAITLDAMDAQGHHQGGLILPGLAMMREALLMRTQIPQLPSSHFHGLLACNTQDAISAAGVHAAAALVERVVAGMRQSEGLQPRVILTGSDAPRLTGLLKLDFEIDQELVMRGLACVARHEERL
jgi:type III pantothenate kinase